MTTDFSPRLLERDHDIRALGEGLLACALPGRTRRISPPACGC